jgi:hypothetical protein
MIVLVVAEDPCDPIFSKFTVSWGQMRGQKVGFAARAVAGDRVEPRLLRLSAQSSHKLAALFAAAAIPSEAAPAKLGTPITKTRARADAIAGFQR